MLGEPDIPGAPPSRPRSLADRAPTRALKPVTRVSRPTSLLDEIPNPRLLGEVPPERRVYDDSPVVDLDEDDEMGLRSMPQVINFSADVSRSCDGDTVKRNGKCCHVLVVNIYIKIFLYRMILER